MPDLSLSVVVITGLLVLGAIILFSLITSNKSKDLDGRRVKSKTRGSDHRKPTKQEKKLQNHANQLIQLKRYVEAAQIFESIKMHREAIDLLEKNDFVDEAAATLLRMNLPNRAAVIYLRNGYFSNAAECFVKAGMYPEAAKAALEGGDHKRAASLFEKAKLYSEAAKSYEKIGDYLASARNLVHGKHIGFAVASYKQYLMNLEKVDKFSLNESDQLALLTWIVQGNFDEVIVSGLQKIGLLPKVVTKVCQLGNMKHCAEIISLGDDYDFNTIISEINYDDHSTLGLADAFFLAGKFNSAGMIFEQLQKFGEAARAFEKAEAFERALYCFERAGDHGNSARVRPLIKKNKTPRDQFPQDFSLASMQSDSQLNFAKNENTAQYPNQDQNQDQIFSLNETTEILGSEVPQEIGVSSSPNAQSDFRFREERNVSNNEDNRNGVSDNFNLEEANSNAEQKLFESDSSGDRDRIDPPLETSSELGITHRESNQVDRNNSEIYRENIDAIQMKKQSNENISISSEWQDGIELKNSDVAFSQTMEAGDNDPNDFQFTAQPKKNDLYNLGEESTHSIVKPPEAIALDLEGEVVSFAVEHSPSNLTNEETVSEPIISKQMKPANQITHPFEATSRKNLSLDFHEAGNQQSLNSQKKQQMEHSQSNDSHGEHHMQEASAILKGSSPTNDVHELFSECEFFSELSSSEIEKVWAAGHIISLEIGEHIITGRKTTDGIMVLLSGSLDCFKQDLSMEQFIGTLSEGESIGELSVLAHIPSEIKVVSKYSCEIWFCDKISFDNFLQHNGKISTKLFRYYLLGILHRLSQSRKAG